MPELSEAHRIVRDSMRRLGRERLAPLAVEADRTGSYSEAIHRLLVENGLFLINVPAEYGGTPMDLTATCLVIEEMGRVDGTIANTVAHHQAGLCCFLVGADEEQRARYLPLIGRGDYLVGFALTETGSGSDAFAMRTRAVLDGDRYAVNGSKCFISNSGLTDVYVLFTTVDPALRRRGVTAFLVEKDTPGLIVGKAEDKMGLRASPTRQLVFEDMRLPRTALLGRPGEGWELVFHSLTRTRILVAAMALGIAQAAMEVAVGYAGTREQFGRPIGEFQGVSFMLADMAVQVECARAMIYQVASQVDRGEEQQAYHASIAKCFASDTAMKVTTDAVQVLGGYGYTTEYPVERMMRDAKATQIIEGTNQIQRVQISRELLKRF
ncbi:MAG: acyl-CoA dehydrogenase family protein [Proteobacteria bacterium]|nr:acyl-CoA dehydrogenase family protein [Pseudomonadota bacterium]